MRAATILIGVMLISPACAFAQSGADRLGSVSYCLGFFLQSKPRLDEAARTPGPGSADFRRVSQETDSRIQRITAYVNQKVYAEGYSPWIVVNGQQRGRDDSDACLLRHDNTACGRTARCQQVDQLLPW